MVTRAGRLPLTHRAAAGQAPAAPRHTVGCQPPTQLGAGRRGNRMTDLVLGISAFYHDSAAALVADGVPVAAAQQERFSRRRHDPSFPADAIRYVLAEA